LKYSEGHLSGSAETTAFDWFHYFWSHGVCFGYYLILITLVAYRKNIVWLLYGKRINNQASDQKC
jgi:hypothetical protein